MADKNENEKGMVRKALDFTIGWINPRSKVQRRAFIAAAIVIAVAEHYYIRGSVVENKRKKKEEGRS